MIHHLTGNPRSRKRSEYSILFALETLERGLSIQFSLRLMSVHGSVEVEKIYFPRHTVIAQTKERSRYITWAKTSESVPIVAKGVRHVCGGTTIDSSPVTKCIVIPFLFTISQLPLLRQNFLSEHIL